MSSRGELFVSEEIRDTYGKKLDKIFGKNNWQLDGSDYYGLYDEKNFPDELEAKILDSLTRNKIIGKITVKVNSYIQKGNFGNYIEVEVGKLVNIKDLR
ncbi:MAG: hypothetical protein ACTSXT_01460 [Candidatus Helarchaeota archaeon]